MACESKTKVRLCHLPIWSGQLIVMEEKTTNKPPSWFLKDRRFKKSTYEYLFISESQDLFSFLFHKVTNPEAVQTDLSVHLEQDQHKNLLNIGVFTFCIRLSFYSCGPQIRRHLVYICVEVMYLLKVWGLLVLGLHLSPFIPFRNVSREYFCILLF